MPKDTVARYLERHAEPLVHEAPDLIDPVQHVICIPACDEDERFEDTLQSITMLDGDETTTAAATADDETAADEDEPPRPTAVRETVTFRV